MLFDSKYSDKDSEQMQNFQTKTLTANLLECKNLKIFPALGARKFFLPGNGLVDIGRKDQKCESSVEKLCFMEQNTSRVYHSTVYWRPADKKV
uniref:Uncharacterized protein n=1 Tax=Romanomermis culicivorax TaxID=13658 RepID=A0A915JK39_ROMCU